MAEEYPLIGGGFTVKDDKGQFVSLDAALQARQAEFEKLAASRDQIKAIEEYTKLYNDLSSSMIPGMRNSVKGFEELGFIVQGTEVLLQDLKIPIDDLAKAFKAAEKGVENLTGAQRKMMEDAVSRLQSMRGGSGDVARGIVGAGKGKKGGILGTLQEELFMGPGGIHLGVGGIASLAMKHPVTAAIVGGLAELNKMTGINAMDPLGTYRETTGIGRATGGGFLSGMQAKGEGIKLGANPFDLISMKMAQEISVAVRQRGFKGKVGNAVAESVGSVVNDLGIEWKDALTTVDTALRLTVTDTENYNDVLELSTAQLKSAKDAAKFQQVPMAEAAKTQQFAQQLLGQWTGNIKGSGAFQSAFTDLLGKQATPDNLKSLLGDDNHIRFLAFLGGGNYLDPMADGGIHVLQGMGVELRRYIPKGMKAEKAAGLPIPRLAELRGTIGAAGIAKVMNMSTTQVGENFAQGQAKTSNELDKAPSDFKSAFDTPRDVHFSIEGFKRFLSGKQKQVPKKFFEAFQDLSPPEQKNFLESIGESSPEAKFLAERAIVRRGTGRGGLLTTSVLPNYDLSSPHGMEKLLADLLRDKTKQEKQEIEVTFKVDGQINSLLKRALENPDYHIRQGNHVTGQRAGFPPSRRSDGTK